MYLLMTLVMKGRRSCEIVGSIVEGIGSSGQVVAQQEEMTCRISSVARPENCTSEGEGESLMCSLGIVVTVNCELTDLFNLPTRKVGKNFCSQEGRSRRGGIGRIIV